jgi:hypothetical protein
MRKTKAPVTSSVRSDESPAAFGVDFETTVASAQTSTRRNAASTIERTDRFTNIENGLVPFTNSTLSLGGTYGSSSVDVRDAVILCQKAYYNFSVFRNIIDLMTEFSNGKISFKKGNTKSRNFYINWWNRLNGWDVGDRFYREYFRSGNVIFHRYEAFLKRGDALKLRQVYGAEVPEEPQTLEEVDSTSKVALPIKYILLNPADIRLTGCASFSDITQYYKLLSHYELSQLRNPQTEQNKAIFDSLPPEIQKQIKNRMTSSVLIPLPLDKTIAIFYKRQDYEPFAVPMGFPVMEDINAKAELKKIDMAIARTMQQIVLLVTTGAEPEKGGVNKNNLEMLKTIFQNQSVGRVLIADYTTKADFIVPKIAELLDPKKYQVLENDINTGLNNVFMGGEKFANQQQKVELFVKRLEEARECFLHNFLEPEMQRIAKMLGFKAIPEPYYESIDLEDNTNMARIYARLVEIGVLTPEQGFKALESNILPDGENTEEEQKEYKKQRDAGLYVPLVGGTKTEDGSSGGRPGGSGTPKSTNTVSPVGTKASDSSSLLYSTSKLIDNMKLSQSVGEEIVSFLKKKHKLKKLNAQQEEIVDGIMRIVVSNEEPVNWLAKAKQYCEKPIDTNAERVNKVRELAIHHDVNEHIAALLLASATDKVPDHAVSA